MPRKKKETEEAVATSEQEPIEDFQQPRASNGRFGKKSASEEASSAATAETAQTSDELLDEAFPEVDTETTSDAEADALDAEIVGTVETALEPIPLKEAIFLSVDEMQKLEAAGLDSLQKVADKTRGDLAELLDVSIDEAEEIVANCARFVEQRREALDASDEEATELLEEDVDGQPFLKGAEPKVTPTMKKLISLGQDMLKKRDAMTDAREAYTQSQELLLETMHKHGVTKFKLDNGQTVYVDVTEKPKVSKSDPDDI